MTTGPDAPPPSSDADERLLSEHLTRLHSRYFKIFSRRDLQRHVRALAGLSSDHPAEVQVERLRDGTVDCTVLAFDYPGVFAAITGVLAGLGFNILSGDVFTYESAPDKASGDRPGAPRNKKGDDVLLRRRIIDHFTGSVETTLPLEAWSAELRERLSAVTALLERGDEASIGEAKQQVNAQVVDRLGRLHQQRAAPLAPVQIRLEQTSGPFTRLRVISEDTPAFLYALCNALSLHRVSIEHVRIRTIRGRIEDEIDLLDVDGSKIEDPALLDRVKLSVLLTKQFTYFLSKAPDPFAALSRFERLVGDVLTKPGEGRWVELLTNPATLQDLARLLGASDYLWEDFIRAQYESLLPMLQPYVRGEDLFGPTEDVGERLARALAGAGSLPEQAERLNAFKDREIFLIDLDQILTPDADFQAFAQKLTVLAEHVVDAAARLVWEDLNQRFGRPQTVAGLPARYTILGLGKLGGAALGYASDLEILLLYSDSGMTDGQQPLQNSEFFDRLVKGVRGVIKAKREGIFHLDLRLRPHGSAGPLAASLESFCRYYDRDGPAHAYERLSLVRLRTVGGDRDLGLQVERLRDEMIYLGAPINLHDLQDLREKQYREKTRGGRPNAKFSPGALVDVEYSVQVLQVTYGERVPELRTPVLSQAIAALTAAGVLAPPERVSLVSAYQFLRRLVNGLRMLRGSAQDLFLPPEEADEYVHLARRMGYPAGAPLGPAEQLRIDFRNHTAAVRTFMERHFGRDFLPGAHAGNVADLVLSDQMPAEQVSDILRSAGFQNPQRVLVNIRQLAGDGERRSLFARLALLAFDILERKPDPDMALNNWERFMRTLGSADFHYRLLFSQPMRLDILLSLFSASQFLADTLIRNPGFLDWLVVPEILHHAPDANTLTAELRAAAERSGSRDAWRNALRRVRRREILRIGARDIFLGVNLRAVTRELSILADSLCTTTLEQAYGKAAARGEAAAEPTEGRFCILALGKLGGRELNYSSDIDLLGVWDDRGLESGAREQLKEFHRRLMERFREDLSQHTEQGYAYRVDLRLRPFGQAGELVPSLSALTHYYRKTASLWELQAALKLRPIAGNLQLGETLGAEIRPLLLRKRPAEQILRSNRKLRRAIEHRAAHTNGSGMDVKNGAGGIRDIEFLTQGLQMIHAPEHPLLLEGNSLTALDLLAEAGVLPAADAERLKKEYVFLRRIEHALQILEDRQNHILPTDPIQLSALARRLQADSARSFMAQVTDCQGYVRDTYERCLLDHRA